MKNMNDEMRIIILIINLLFVICNNINNEENISWRLIGENESKMIKDDRFIMKVNTSISYIGSCGEGKSLFHENIQLTKYDNNFMKWLCDNGFLDNERMKIKNIPNAGRGMVAMQSLKTKDELMFLPNILFLYPDSPLLRLQTIHATAVCKGVLRRPSSISTGVEFFIASIALMMERRNPNSFFKPYIDTLHHPYAPFFFPSKYIKAFGYSFIEQHKGYHIANSLKHWQTIRKLDFFRDLATKEVEFPKHSLLEGQDGQTLDQQFEWAAYTILQRSYNYGPDARMEYMLLPVLDIFNHRNHIENQYSFSSTFNNVVYDSGMHNSVTMDTEEGGELFNQYSYKNNMILLLQYGFILDNNRLDYISFQVKPKGDNMKKIIMNRFGSEVFEFAIDMKGIRMKDLVVFASLLQHKIVEHWNSQNAAYTLKYLSQIIPTDLFPDFDIKEENNKWAACEKHLPSCVSYERSAIQFRRYVRKFGTRVKQVLDKQYNLAQRGVYKNMTELVTTDSDPIFMLEINLPDEPYILPGKSPNKEPQHNEL